MTQWCVMPPSPLPYQTLRQMEGRERTSVLVAEGGWTEFLWCDESWMFLGDVLQHRHDDPFYPDMVDNVYWFSYLLICHEWVFNCVKCFFFLCLSRWQVVSVLHCINTLFSKTEGECWSNTAILGKILHSPLQNVCRFGLHIRGWGCMHCYFWQIWVCSFLVMASLALVLG